METSAADPAAPPPTDPEEPEDGARRGGSDRRRLIGLIAGLVAVALVVVLLIVGQANRRVDTEIDDALARGQRPAAPDLTLPVLVAGPGVGPVGSEVSLASLRGRPVVLNLWASWCDPCREEAPILEQVWARYKDRGVVVLGLDTQDLTEKAMAFIRRYRLTYPSLRDPGDDSKRRLGATGVPETWIIDRDGNVALHQIGQVTRPEQITQPLDQVLAGS